MVGDKTNQKERKMKKQNLKQKLMTVNNTNSNKKSNTKFFNVCGHNHCPQCGAAVYSLIKDGIYRVGCRKCGMDNGAKFPFCEEDPSYAIQTTRREWNRRFFDAKLTQKAMSVMGIENGDYLVVERFDGDIWYVASTRTEAIAFIAEQEECNTYFDIYIIEDDKAILSAN